MSDIQNKNGKHWRVEYESIHLFNLSTTKIIRVQYKNTIPNEMSNHHVLLHIKQRKNAQNVN